MRLFLISNMYPTDEFLGYGIFVRNVVELLPRYGVEVPYRALIFGKAKGTFGKIGKYIRFYLDIVRSFFKDYDCIYLHFPNQAVPMLAFLYHLRKKCLVVNFHGEDLLYESAGISGFLGRRMEHFLRYVKIIIVPSEYFRQIVIDRGLCSSDRVVVSPSGGVDQSIFYPERTVASEKLRLGFVGRLEESKGIWDFVESVRILSGTYDIAAAIVGYGTCEAQLYDYLSTTGLDKIIRLVGGVSQSKLCSYYNSFDLYVFPSRRESESLGLTGVEAMACGTPVVGNNVGGIATYLKDGENGFLVEPGDVGAIVSVVKKYAALTPQEKNRMQKSCLQTASLYFRDKVVGDLAEVLKYASNTSLF